MTLLYGRRMQKRRLSRIVLAVFLSLACSGGSLNLDGPFDIPDPNPGGVGIGEVRPTEGASGDIVQIFGVNLGFPGTRVEIGGISAPIQSRSMTQIVVVVPNVAPGPGYSLAVLVEESESFPGGFSIIEGFTVLED